MGSLKQGARQAVSVCMGIQPGEKVLIITDLKTLEVGTAIFNETAKITPWIKFFIVEYFGKRPVKKIPEEIMDILQSSDVAFLLIEKVMGETEVWRPLRVKAQNKVRFANCRGITKQIMEQGLSADHRKIWKFSKKVYDQVSKCKEMYITSKAGTDLKVEFSRKYRWMNSNGDYRRLPQTGTNLPGAEVFTCPERVDGTLVVDGIMGDYFTSKYGELRNSPVRWVIRNSRVIAVSCSNKKLEKEMKEYMKTDKNSNRIGEIGFGTNILLKKLIGVFLQDEKFPTVHIAVGDPYASWTGAKWSSEVHCDGLVLEATVVADGKKLMENGKYT